MQNTIIELEDTDYAIVIAANGAIKEFYLPTSLDDDTVVPNSISAIVDIIQEQKEDEKIRH